jgi:hypothetical protein
MVDRIKNVGYDEYMNEGVFMITDESRAVEEVFFQEEDMEAIRQYNEYWADVHFEEETYWYELYLYEMEVAKYEN